MCDNAPTMDLVPCKRCGQNAVALPEGALISRALTCRACGVEQPISDYLSGADAFRRASAAAMRNRAQLAEAQRDGVKCSACGASVPLPADVSTPSFPCGYCHAQLVTSNYVAPELMMGLGIRAQLSEMRDASNRTNRRVALALGIGIPLVIVIVIAVMFVAHPP